MRQKILTIFILLFFISVSIANAQENDRQRPPWREKVYFGGGLGLQFGTITQIEVSPLAGYRFTPRFSSGIGLTYHYYKDTRFDFSTYIYGGSVFTRLNVFSSIFAHAEVEPLNVASYEYDPNSPSGNVITVRKWVTGVLVGGGYSQSLGKNSSAYILLLWNINETADSPYNNPIIRVGFTF